MTRERVFTILSGLLLLAAAVLLWWNNLTAAFVTATLGIVAWFLSYRAQTRARAATESPIESIERDEELED
jgi:preprotein translocase subunit YajC